MSTEFNLEYVCPSCGEPMDIRGSIDWGVTTRKIFKCLSCEDKTVIDLGCHCPEDVNLPENIEENYIPQ